MRGFRRQHRVGEKAEDPDAVVEADDHDAARGQPGPVVKRIGRGAADKGAAVDEYHHRLMTVQAARGGPHVDGQAVLVRLLSGGDHVRHLHAVVAEAGRVAYAFPGQRRLRRPPAQRADGRCGVGHTLEGQDLAVRGGNRARARRDDPIRPRLGSGNGREEQRQESKTRRVSCGPGSFHSPLRRGCGARASMMSRCVAFSSTDRHTSTFAAPLTGRV